MVRHPFRILGFYPSDARFCPHWNERSFAWSEGPMMSHVSKHKENERRTNAMTSHQNIPTPLTCFFLGGDRKCKLHFCGGPGGTLKCNLDPWDVFQMDVFFGGGGGEK